MQGKNTVKYNFLYSILDICSECNLVRHNINSTEKNCDQTLAKNGEQSQENVKCLNTRGQLQCSYLS